MRLRKRALLAVGWITAVIVIGYTFVAHLLMAFNVVFPGVSHVYNGQLMLFAISLAGVVMAVRLSVGGKVSTFVAVCTGLTGVSAISTIVNVPLSMLVSSLIAVCFWWSIAVLVDIGLDVWGRDVFLFSIMVVFGVVAAIYLYLSLSTHNLIPRTTLTVNAVYYVLLFLPFVLACPNRRVRAASLAVIVFSVLFSLKRTGFIATIVALLVYYLVKVFVHKGNLPTTLYRVASLVIITTFTFYAYNFVVKTYNLDIIVRLLDMVADEGSGRLYIYHAVMDRLNRLDFPSLILGAGYNGVYREVGLGLSAHNDFLEVLYNYGFFGISLYIGMIFTLVRSCVRILKVSAAGGAAFAASLALFLIMSMTSHLILYPTYYVVLVAYWCWASKSQFKEGVC